MRNNTIKLIDVLPYLSSKRHKYFEEEKDQILEALMNCNHFLNFRMDEQLKNALIECYEEINYFLIGEKKILHQYGKNSENQFFIIKGQANVYEYKKDSDLEIECFYMAERSKIKELIQYKKDQAILQKKTITSSSSTLGIKTNQTLTSITQPAQIDTPSLSLTEEQSKILQLLAKDISVLERELLAIENLLDKRFQFFDHELDFLRNYDQFFIDDVCLLKFVRKLKENDSFGTVENNRDQIIISSSEIHLASISTDLYQINLIPLKAINEFFNFYLQQSNLHQFFSPRNISQQLYSKSQLVYGDQQNLVQKNNKSQSDRGQERRIQFEEESKGANLQFCGQNNTIYLVRKGIFQLSKLKQKIFIPIRTLRPGDFFGIEELYMNKHVFRVTCLSERGSVLAYSLPLLNIIDNNYQLRNQKNSNYPIELEQQNKIVQVQQKLLQYYIKIFLDVLEQPIENSKNQCDIISPLIDKLVSLEQNQLQEYKEIKLIKIDNDLTLQMSLEDHEKQIEARFQHKLQPYLIQTIYPNQPLFSLSHDNSQSIQIDLQNQNSQNTFNQQQINPENIENKHYSMSTIVRPTPNLSDLVNVLQNKINSRKQSKETLVLKRKDSQVQAAQQIRNINEEKSISNINQFYNNKSDFIGNFSQSIISQQQLEQQVLLNQKKQQKNESSYQFQQFVAKSSSRNISPYNNNMRSNKKLFTIAPMQEQQEGEKKEEYHYNFSSSNIETSPNQSKTPLSQKIKADMSLKSLNKNIVNNYQIDLTSQIESNQKLVLLKKQNSLKLLEQSYQNSLNCDKNDPSLNLVLSPYILKKSVQKQEALKKNVIKIQDNRLQSYQSNQNFTKIQNPHYSSDSLPLIQQNIHPLIQEIPQNKLDPIFNNYSHPQLTLTKSQKKQISQTDL